jgi:hypothetical protein
MLRSLIGRKAQQYGSLRPLVGNDRYVIASSIFIIDGQRSAGSEVHQVSPLRNCRNDIIEYPEMNYLISNVFSLR